MEELTKKQAGFIKDYLETGNGVQAALNNYDTEDYDTAKSIASENLTKPYIMQRIIEASKVATNTIINLAMSAENEAVRLNASKDILDRGGFKPAEVEKFTNINILMPVLVKFLDKDDTTNNSRNSS